jgi:hypothetical protein
MMTSVHSGTDSGTNSATYSLTLLPGEYALCQLPPNAPIPPWTTIDGDFWTMTRTQDELSIICAQAHLPAATAPEISVARDWRLLRVEGPFDFETTGVLATLSEVLARAEVVLLAVATYRTDYLLVKAEQLERVIPALRDAGHRITV